MKTLIILKGLAKDEKLNWVSEQGLDNFFIDYSVFKKLYSMPEIDRDGTDILGRTNINLIYRSWLEAVNNKLESGCLVVVDYDLEKTRLLEDMAMIYGYTCFYKIFDIPYDYISNPKKYSIPGFKKKSKEELEEEVKTFLDCQTSSLNKISTYSDVLDYWKNKETVLKLNEDDDLYFISDLHSNYSLYKSIDLPVESFKIHLGDYIDGPEIGGSKRLIEEIIKFSSGYNIFLEGNHERRLRKFLYWRWAFKHESKKVSTKSLLTEVLYNSLPQDFLDTTAKEFQNLIPTEALEWLKALNRQLKTHVIIVKDNNTFYCTHAGIKCLEQLSPKFIGNVIYGNRDMDMYDKSFSSNVWKPSNKRWSINNWSVHAHCKYPDNVDFLKYDGVVNLDPSSNNEIVYLKYNNINNLKPCVVQ